MLRTLVLATLALVADAWADTNPFVREVPAPPPAALPIGPAARVPVPPLPPAPILLPDPEEERPWPAFSENRALLDGLAVVGVKGRWAVLRYPGSGAVGPQSPGYKVVTVADGDRLVLNGRKYLVHKEGTLVRLMATRGSKTEAVWMGDLDAPPVTTPAPAPTGEPQR